MIPEIKLVFTGAGERGTSKKYTAYEITVQVGDYSGVVEKRYNEFRKLHTQLSNFYSLPTLPPKKAFGNRNPEFVTKRKEELETYMRKIVANEHILNASELLEFLNIPKSYCVALSPVSLQALTPSTLSSALSAGRERSTRPAAAAATPARSDENMSSTNSSPSEKDMHYEGGSPSGSSPGETPEGLLNPTSGASDKDLKNRCLRAFQTGSHLLQKGNFEDAERHLRFSLTLIEKGVISEENKVTALASCLNFLALACKELKRYDEAEELCRRAIAMGDTLPQALHVKCLNTLAITYSSQKKTAEAQELYLKILELMDTIPSAKESPVYAIAEGNLAQNYAEQQNVPHSPPHSAEHCVSPLFVKFDKAIFHQKHSYELLAATKGAEHPKTVESLHQLAVLYGESNEFEEARKLYDLLLGYLKNVNPEYKHVVKMMESFKYVIINTDKPLAKKAEQIIASYV